MAFAGSRRARGSVAAAPDATTRGAGVRFGSRGTTDMQGTRHASAGVLARIYTALAGARQTPSRSTTAVVLAGVSVDAAVAERLDRLAIDVYDIGRDPAVEPAA